MSYEGWANYDTWNVALWLNNDEGLYRSMTEYLSHNDPMYQDFIYYIGLEESMTPDRIAWLSPNLDLERLDEMLKEHQTELRMYQEN
jgi:hypothetical protein